MSLLETLYSRSALSTQINKIKPVETFLLDKIFKTKVPNSSELVIKPVYAGNAQLAQFAGPHQERGHLIGKDALGAVQFQVPRTYERMVFTAKELNDFNILGNVLDLQQSARFAAQADWITRHLQKLQTRVIRLREKMCGELLTTGKIVVNQSEVAFTLDLGFVADAQLITLANADKWSENTSDPLANIQAWKRLVKGADMMLLGTTAAAEFVKNEAVRKALDTNNYSVGRLDLTNEYSEAVTFIGMINGIKIYEYIQQYESGGTSYPIIPADRAIVVNSKKEFTIEQAPIYRINDKRGEAFLQEFYISTVVNDDKTKLEWSCEQKSVPFISYLDSVASVDVC